MPIEGVEHFSSELDILLADKGESFDDAEVLIVKRRKAGAQISVERTWNITELVSFSWRGRDVHILIYECRIIQIEVRERVKGLVADGCGCHRLTRNIIEADAGVGAGNAVRAT